MPFAEFGLIFGQKRTQKALKGVRQSGIRNVALVLIEFAGCEKTTRRYKGLMEFIDNGGLADTGIAGNKNQLWPAAGYNPAESSEQGG